MNEDMNKLDQLFEKAFSGFEESPPEAVKSTVFRRIRLFSTWQLLRKYVVIFAILLMVGGIAYYSGAFSSGKTKKYTPRPNSTDYLQMSKANSSAVIITDKTNTINSSNPNESGSSDPTPNNIAENSYSQKSVSVNPVITPNKAKKHTINQTQKQKESTTVETNKPVQYDKTNTSQITPSSSKTTSTSGQDITTLQQNVKRSSETNKGQSTEQGNSQLIARNEISVVQMVNGLSAFINDRDKEELLIQLDDYSTINSKNRKAPLLWSVGLNLGQSLWQPGCIKTSEQVSDNNFNLQSKLNFPSGFAGLNVRAEKKHFFFDFGLQYAGFSEKISSNQLLYNSQQVQNVDYLGQNMVIDTNGGYWHYFYLSTTTISIIDSVWTLRIDTTLVSLYDTSYLQRYDTLKDPSWINTYAQFEFPLNVGWTKNFGNFNLGISTGPIFCLLVGSKGKMPYRITHATQMVATKQEFQAFKFGISWQISAILSYQFSDRMKLVLSPYYRHTLLPYTSSMSSASLKINSLGLQFGIRYYF